MMMTVMCILCHLEALYPAPMLAPVLTGSGSRRNETRNELSGLSCSWGPRVLATSTPALRFHNFIQSCVCALDM